MTKQLLGKYKLVLGLEIHMHVKTVQKMFCGCDANFYNAEANTYTCPTCLGLPGALPVPNLEAIKKTQLFGLALGCSLNKNTKFDRKHYFYPDLPKGYQISQYQEPLCGEGRLELSSGRFAEIERLHLEEDTAKSFHAGDKTLVDFNKSGVPLMELVTKPCFTTVEDAVDFCKKIRDLVRFLNIGDADMEKGQLRIEPNISLRTAEMEEAGDLPKYKVEIKNINSFKFMEKAVRAEIKRQRKLLETGETPVQENRGYDEYSKTTVPQRTKEEASDYRYFPEPDIPPMVFDEKYFAKLKAQLPELPAEKCTRYITELGLDIPVAEALTSAPVISWLEKFETLVNSGADPALVANLLINKPEFRGLSDEEFLSKVADMQDRVDDVGALEPVIEKVLAANPDVVESYKSGKVSVLEFLVGQVMRDTKGKADAGVVRELLRKGL